MALSRIFHLAGQLNQLQKARAHHPRQDTPSALQFSLQNEFDLAHYGLTLGWNRPVEFKYAAVVRAYICYASIELMHRGVGINGRGVCRLCAVRGQIYWTFDKIRSEVMVWFHTV
jgi:hypothetical protein